MLKTMGSKPFYLGISSYVKGEIITFAEGHFHIAPPMCRHCEICYLAKCGNLINRTWDCHRLRLRNDDAKEGASTIAIGTVVSDESSIETKILTDLNYLLQISRASLLTLVEVSFNMFRAVCNW